MCAVLVLAAVSAAADVRIGLNAKGADNDPAKARPKDRLVWTGRDWTVVFTGKSPCQNGKSIFSSKETGTNRMCIISVTCTESDRSGCGRYKYTSAAEGAPGVDPEVDVDILSL